VLSADRRGASRGGAQIRVKADLCSVATITELDRTACRRSPSLFHPRSSLFIPGHYSPGSLTYIGFGPRVYAPAERAKIFAGDER
jgi:hypothetical protein